jgi:hypothetical protein
MDAPELKEYSVRMPIPERVVDGLGPELGKTADRS